MGKQEELGGVDRFFDELSFVEGLGCDHLSHYCEIPKGSGKYWRI